MTKSDFNVAQIARDEEIARQLEVELIDVDHELAVEWTREEQDKCTVDERAKLLVEYFKRRKKQLAEVRAVAIRNKPSTKTQLRRLMMTYLKNMDFVPIGSEEDERMIIDMNKKAEEESSDKEGVDLILWGDLRTMFEANAEDELWHNQEKWSLKRWNFYENCRIHILILEDGIEIHMLEEKRYPLTTRTLERMLSLRLIVESASDATYDLLRLIQKQIDECGGNDRGENDL
uniref:Uncharacterized protein n=1 Tax=Tanacetum cinerariifolium TaxID=118510 RepID=A0A6L2N7W4_TANCI|nr:hypothetical protein [Tanacetum cinerariifolium]